MSFDTYIGVALWSSNDMNTDDTFLDSEYTISDLAPETREYLESLYDSFWEKNESLLDQALKHQNGKNIDHLLWLSQNRHGRGFCDGEFPDHIGVALKKASQKLPEISLYAHNGLIYHFGGQQ